MFKKNKQDVGRYGDNGENMCKSMTSRTILVVAYLHHRITVNIVVLVGQAKGKARQLVFSFGPLSWMILRNSVCLVWSILIQVAHGMARDGPLQSDIGQSKQQLIKMRYNFSSSHILPILVVDTVHQVNTSSSPSSSFHCCWPLWNELLWSQNGPVLHCNVGL